MVSYPKIIFRVTLSWGKHKMEDQNYDITTIHYKVVEILSQDKNKVSEIDEVIDSIREEINSYTKKVDKIGPQNRLDSLMKTREEYANNTRLKLYRKETAEYLSTYSSIRGYPDLCVIELDGKKHTAESLRDHCTSIYVTITRKYCKISAPTKKKINYNLCENCGFPLNSTICSACGSNSIREDISSGSIKSKVKTKQYSAILNFMKHVEAKSGKHCTDPFLNVLEDLTKLCKNRYYTPDQIRQMPLEADGRRGPYTMIDFVKHLKESGHSNRNKDKDAIIEMHWGWKLYDYSSIMKDIYELASKFHIFYTEYTKSEDKNKERSMINREFLLLKISLWFPNSLGGPIASMDKFDYITTSSIFSYYEKCFQVFSKQLNDPRYPFIPLKGGSFSNGSSLLVDDEMEKDQHFEKFCTATNQLNARLLNVMNKLIDGGYLNIAAPKLAVLKSHMESQTPEQKLAWFTEKFFADGIESRVSSIISRDIDYFKLNISSGLPKDKSMRSIAEPIVNQLVKLIDEKITVDGKQVFIIPEKTRNVIWSFIETITEEAILYYSKSDTPIPGHDDKILTLKLVQPLLEHLSEKRGSLSK